jgi:predicted DNA repair protein MutK
MLALFCFVLAALASPFKSKRCLDTITLFATVSGERTPGAMVWLVTAFLDAVFGILLGLVLMPVVNMLIVPVGLTSP